MVGQGSSPEPQIVLPRTFLGERLTWIHTPQLAIFPANCPGWQPPPKRQLPPFSAVQWLLHSWAASLSFQGFQPWSHAAFPGADGRGTYRGCLGSRECLGLSPFVYVSLKQNKTKQQQQKSHRLCFSANKTKMKAHYANLAPGIIFLDWSHPA